MTHLHDEVDVEAAADTVYFPMLLDLRGYAPQTGHWIGLSPQVLVIPRQERRVAHDTVLAGVGLDPPRREAGDILRAAIALRAARADIHRRQRIVRVKQSVNSWFPAHLFPFEAVGWNFDSVQSSKPLQSSKHRSEWSGHGGFSPQRWRCCDTLEHSVVPLRLCAKDRQTSGHIASGMPHRTSGFTLRISFIKETILLVP